MSKFQPGFEPARCQALALNKQQVASLSFIGDDSPFWAIGYQPLDPDNLVQA